MFGPAFRYHVGIVKVPEAEVVWVVTPTFALPMLLPTLKAGRSEPNVSVSATQVKAADVAATQC